MQTQKKRKKNEVKVWDNASPRRFCSSFEWFSEVQHQQKQTFIITPTSHPLKSTQQRRIQKLWRIRSIWGISNLYAERKIWKCVPNQYEYILTAENLPESTVVFVQRMQKLDIKPVQSGSDLNPDRLYLYYVSIKMIFTGNRSDFTWLKHPWAGR